MNVNKSQRQKNFGHVLLLCGAVMVMLLSSTPVFQLSWDWWNSDSNFALPELQDFTRQQEVRAAEFKNLKELQCKTPIHFPKAIELSRQDYENWAREIKVKDMWTAFPQTQEDVIQIANWAVNYGYTLRPIGYKHNWSPTTVAHSQPSCGKVVLINTTKYLTKMKMVSTEPHVAAVQVETGTALDNFLVFLDDHGFGIASHPASGDISIGGIIAVGGHGACVPSPGFTCGSLSNLVVSLNAVVWNEKNRTFEIRTFDRTNPETKYLLVNLGRIFLTKVVIRVIPKFSMRCTSRTDITANELFADPSISSPITFDKLLNQSTSVEFLWFVSTPKPWLRIWNIEPTKPSTSTQVSTAYNYPLTDSWPEQLKDLVEIKLISNWHSWTPLLGKLGYLVAQLSKPADIWGTSKNVLLYVQSTTIRMSQLGYAVITSRQQLQLVLSQFTTFYKNLTEWYAEQNLYPVSAGLHIRVSGLDEPEAAGIKNAESPALSVLSPVAGRTELDRAIWITVSTFTNNPNSTNFMRQLERFLITNYPPALAIVRPEWSKSWAYSENSASAWANKEMITKTIPDLYNSTGDWSLAVSTFNTLDPRRVFTNDFINLLFR